MTTATATMPIEELKKKPFDELTTEEFELLKAEKQKQVQRQRERERKAYEAKKHQMVYDLTTEAIELNERLRKFKAKCLAEYTNIKSELENYGDLRANSKGGFSLRTEDDKFKITYTIVNIPLWDERSEKAEALLKEFLSDTVKKRDKDLHDILLTFLEKNKEGKFEYSRIQSLYQHEDKFTDARWKEAIRLFKESFKTVFAKNRVDFYSQNIENGYDTISLNLSKL